jgi:hypothetical protein
MPVNYWVIIFIYACTQHDMNVPHYHSLHVCVCVRMFSSSQAKHEVNKQKYSQLNQKCFHFLTSSNSIACTWGSDYFSFNFHCHIIFVWPTGATQF